MDDLIVNMIDLAGGVIFLSDGQILIITDWLNSLQEPTEEMNDISYLSASNDEIGMLINLSCAGARTH